MSENNTAIPEEIKSTWSYSQLSQTAIEILNIFYSNKNKHTGVKLTHARAKKLGYSSERYSLAIKRLLSNGFVERRKEGVHYLYTISERWVNGDTFTDDGLMKANKDIQKAGFVYLMTAGKYTKIGIASNVKSRLNGIQTANPEEVSVIFSRDVYQCLKHEWHLHRMYRNKWVRGEWFLLDPYEINEVIDYLNNQDVVDYESIPKTKVDTCKTMKKTKTKPISKTVTNIDSFNFDI